MLVYTQLAQHRENSTNPVSVYSTSSDETVQVFLKLTNLTNDVVAVRVFHDLNGTTYDQSTALVWDLELGPGTILELDHVFMDDSTGNLAYRTDTANAINATVYGIIK